MRATTAQACIEAAASRLRDELQTPDDIWPDHIREALRWLDEALAALAAVPRADATTAQALKDRERRRYQYADDAMKIVAAIKRDYLPDMDEHDGGEIYSWILDLAEKAAAQQTPQEENAMIPPETVICPWCKRSVPTHVCAKYHRTIRGGWCPGGGASPVERAIKARDRKTPHDEDPAPSPSAALRETLKEIARLLDDTPMPTTDDGFATIDTPTHERIHDAWQLAKSASRGSTEPTP